MQKELNVKTTAFTTGGSCLWLQHEYEAAYIFVLKQVKQ